MNENVPETLWELINSLPLLENASAETKDEAVRMIDRYCRYHAEKLRHSVLLLPHADKSCGSEKGTSDTLAHE